VSGIRSLPLAISLWSIGGIFLVVAAYLWIEWLRGKKQKPRKDKGVVPHWLSARRKRVKIDVSEAKYTEYIQAKGCFLVTVTLRLQSTRVPLQLAWLQLVITGKAFDPISSKPPLTDKIEHREQTYELQYEVDYHAFRKGQLTESNLKQPSDNSRGFILANAGGKEWRSEEFEIKSPPFNPQQIIYVKNNH